MIVRTPGIRDFNSEEQLLREIQNIPGVILPENICVIPKCENPGSAKLCFLPQPSWPKVPRVSLPGPSASRRTPKSMDEDEIGQRLSARVYETKAQPVS